MSAIQVKHVPEELHEALRERAARAGMDLQDYVLALIRRDLALPSQEEWLDSLHAQPSSNPQPPAAAVLAVTRAERQRELVPRADRH